MKCKIFIIITLILLIKNNTTLSATQYKEHKLKTIVIDPGHGGIDSGAVGKSSKEKDIALAIAIKLGNLIKARYKNINVIYTRQSDKTVTIYDRANISNKSKSDLLISIHCNASYDNRANGIEIITMSLNQYNKKQSSLAIRENSVIMIERNYKKIYKNYNPKSQEFNILNSLLNMANSNISIEIAQTIQNELISRTKKKSRGVKQDSLILFYITSAPTILIEVGFLTNLKEEAYLKSNIGQEEIANAILNGIIKYKKKLERS